MKLRVKAKTHKAKNRIHENGDTWHVVKHVPHPISGRMAFFVMADEHDVRSDHRWIIDGGLDRDFEIIEVLR
jgi:hypothetical protein